MDEYCRIFVRRDGSEDDLADLVTRIVGGRRRFRRVEGGGLAVDVLTNPGADPDLAAEGTDRFLAFPFHLEVEPARSEPPASFVERVEALLVGLRADGCWFVTAAGVEDDLVDRGRHPSP